MSEEKKQCGNCKFGEPDKKTDLIECRKCPPKFLSNPEFNQLGAWPLIAEYCWCGHFQSKGEAQ
ncbi:MAG: hypothetical protein DHS20C07_18870 [Methyloligella sp.]|nr:MAG: hypothetical protein DHS20C07_18870 [Methyloligella sp.]